MDNPLTLQEAKDQVAINLGKESWDAACAVNDSFAEANMDAVAELYARSKWDEACEAQRKECSRCLEVDIPKSPTHNLVLYASKPTFKP